MMVFIYPFEDRKIRHNSSSIEVLEAIEDDMISI